MRSSYLLTSFNHDQVAELRIQAHEEAAISVKRRAMTSILTNNSAMAALSTLQAVNSQLTKTQTQASSGLRVQTAKDNAAYWAISTTMKSDSSAMSAAQDAMGLGQALVDVTYNGMDAIRQELTTIKNLVITASALPTAATDGYSNWTDNTPDGTYDQSQVAAVDGEINQHMQQIMSIVKSSSFNGVNLLLKQGADGPITGTTTDFVSGYADGKVQKISIDNKALVMVNYNRTTDNFPGQPGSAENGIMDSEIFGAQTTYLLTDIDIFTGLDTNNQNPYFLRGTELEIGRGTMSRGEAYNLLLDGLDRKIATVQSGMSALGSVKTRIQQQSDFASSLIDDTNKGVGRLVDANMEETSTKLAAEQTQQQLAVQSLQIANAAPQAMLQLFKQ